MAIVSFSQWNYVGYHSSNGDNIGRNLGYWMNIEDKGTNIETILVTKSKTMGSKFGK